MPFQKNKAPRYAKGFSEAAVYDIGTGDLLYWTNKLKTGNTSTSMNDGAIEGGLDNKLLANIPDTVRLTGTFEAADFSLEARGLQMGSTVKYNAKTLVRRKIIAKNNKLTLPDSDTPAPAYGQPSDAATYFCHVGNDGVNYGVDPETKEVQGFTGEEGKEYCVFFYTNIFNAEQLTIPAQFSPTVAYMVIKTPMYSENGLSSKNSSLAGYLYGFYPRVQFVGGDAGVNGSQTDATTTSLNFTALAYDDMSDDVCADCGSDDSVYGYLVYVPCGEDFSSVKALAIVGGIITVKQGEKAQVPVFYAMDNDQIVTPNYNDLTFKVAEDGGSYASVGEHTGIITGSSAGSTTITVTVTAKPTLTATANVTVTAAE